MTEDLVAVYIPRSLLPALGAFASMATSSAPRAPEYSSVNLPAGVTRRRFAARCKNIPEAVRDGYVWRVPVEVYERHLRQGPSPRGSFTKGAPNTLDRRENKHGSSLPPKTNDTVEDLLAGSGIRLRSVGGRR